MVAPRKTPPAPAGAWQQPVRKDAQKALSRAMASLELALDGAEAAPWEYNLKTRHVEWSPRGYRQLGLAVGQTRPSLEAFLASTHPDDRPAVERIRAEEQSAPPGTKFTMQLRLVTAEGGICWIERRSIIGPDEPGGRRVFGLDIDITARMEAEKKLRDSEERYRELADFMPQIIWQADATGVLRYVNNRWTELTGLPVSAVIGELWLPGMLPEDLPGAQQAWASAQAAASVFEHEWRLRLPDGRLYWLLTRGRPIIGERGEVLRWIGTDTDITDRKRAEDALRVSMDRMQIALAAGQLGDWTWNAATDLLDLSPRACEIFGIAPSSSLTWTKLQKLLDPADAPRAMAAVEEAMRSGQDYAIEYRINRPDGTPLWVAARGRPTYGERGAPSGMIGVVQDVSERKRHEQHLRLLINELNHRVKNTLATVQSIAGQTLRFSRDTAEARTLFEARLVALAKAHDVLTKENWEGASLTEIVEKAIAPHNVDGTRFIIDGPGILVPPKYALALSMALHELCTNAMKYGALSSPAGRVRIVWAAAGTKKARELLMRWQEEGGPPVAPPSRRGFGSRLIEQGLSQDLGGEVALAYRAEGVLCTIRAPLEPLSGEPLPG